MQESVLRFYAFLGLHAARSIIQSIRAVPYGNTSQFSACQRVIDTANRVAPVDEAGAPVSSFSFGLTKQDLGR